MATKQELYKEYARLGGNKPIKSFNSVADLELEVGELKALKEDEAMEKGPEPEMTENEAEVQEAQSEEAKEVTEEVEARVETTEPESIDDVLEDIEEEKAEEKVEDEDEEEEKPKARAGKIKPKRKGNLNPQPLINKAVAFALVTYDISLEFDRSERTWCFKDSSGGILDHVTSKEFAILIRDKAKLTTRLDKLVKEHSLDLPSNDEEETESKSAA